QEQIDPWITLAGLAIAIDDARAPVGDRYRNRLIACGTDRITSPRGNWQSDLMPAGGWNRDGSLGKPLTLHQYRGRKEYDAKQPLDLVHRMATCCKGVRQQEHM